MNISSWILSIAGICLLSVVVDLILPKGKMNKTIKNVFSYIVILIVLAPLPKLVNSNFNIEQVFDYVEFNVQGDYIYNLNQAKIDKYANIIDERITQSGIHGAIVSISANIFDTNLKIDAVYVDLYNIVINENLKNKDIKMEVLNIVKEVLNIKEECVVFYEWKRW